MKEKDIKIYWKQKNGIRISVDDMTEQHAKNTLKMVLRLLEKERLERIENAVPKVREVRLNGEMAQMFNDQQEMAEDPFYEDTDYPY